MQENDYDRDRNNEPIIQEIIELERSYYFKKHNAKSARQSDVKKIIERHIKPEQSPQ